MKIRRVLSHTVGVAVSVALASGSVLGQQTVAFTASAGPAQVTQIATRELARLRYQIITSDANTGLVVAKRVGTPYELVSSVRCRTNAYTGTVTHTVTVTAQASGASGGSSVEISSDAALTDNKIQFQTCEADGYIERTVRAAILSAPSNTAVNPPVPAAIGARETTAPGDYTTSAAGKSSAAPVTIEQVLQMIGAKLPDDVIIASIQKSGLKFDVTPESLIRLKTAGASDPVLRTASGLAVRATELGIANPNQQPAGVDGAVAPGASVADNVPISPDSQRWLAGKWSGDGSDSSGPGHFDWDVNEGDASFTGHLRLSDVRSGISANGSIAGTLSGSRVTFTMTIPKGALPGRQRDCEGMMRGSADLTRSGQLDGAYEGTMCGRRVTKGTFALTRSQ